MSVDFEIVDTSDGWAVLNSDLLRQARKKAGLTQKQLGEQIGRSGAAVSTWESGERNNPGATPDAETIRKICLVLQIRPDNLLYLQIKPKV